MKLSKYRKPRVMPASVDLLPGRRSAGVAPMVKPIVTPIAMAVLTLVAMSNVQPALAETKTIPQYGLEEVWQSTTDDYIVEGGTLHLMEGGKIGDFNDISVSLGSGSELIVDARSAVLGGISAIDSHILLTEAIVDVGESNIDLQGKSTVTMNRVNLVKRFGTDDDAILRMNDKSKVNMRGGFVIQETGGDSTAVEVNGASQFSASGALISGGAEGIVSSCEGVGCRVALKDSQVMGRSVGIDVKGSSGLSTLSIDGGTVIGTGKSSTTSTLPVVGDGIAIFAFDAMVNAQIKQGAHIIGNGAEGAGLDVLNDKQLAPGITSVAVSDASISGRRDGIRIQPTRDVPVDQTSHYVTNISLANTRVHGGTGAAIDAAGGTTTVTATGRSVLSSDNGILLSTHPGTTFQLNLVNLSAVQHGNIVNDGGVSNVLLQNSTLSGGMTGVSRVEIDTGGDWSLTQSSTADRLSMNGGTVNLNGKQNRQNGLTVRQLDGQGAFRFATNGQGGASDRLVVTGEGLATGRYVMTFADEGADPTALGAIQVVQTNGGGATFTIPNGAGANLGTFQYQLVQNGDNWELQPTNKTTPTANSVLNSIGATPTIWYGQLTPMLSRLGELNFSQTKDGVWVRPYASRMRVKASAGSAFDQDQSGVAVGADTRIQQVLGGDLFVGGVFNYSRSTLNDNYGAQGKIDAYSVGAYAGWLGPLGYYLHALVNLNRYVSTAQVATPTGYGTGSSNTSGIGVVLEGGKRVELPVGMFVQPYAQFSNLHMTGQHYDLTNGLTASGNRTNSLQAALGVIFGEKLESAKAGVAEPYIRAAVAHEFVSGNTVQVNDNAFNANLSGSRVELGGGVAWQMGKQLSANLDYTYAKGKKLTQPFALNAGLRYSW